MKRSTWLAASIGVIAAVAIGFRAVDTYRPTPVVQQEMAAMPVLARNVQRADRIQIVRRGATLNLERRGQIWGLAQSGGYPVKPAMAERLLDQLLALRLSHPSTPDHAELRVDEPREAKATLTGVRVQAINGAGLGALIVADHDPGAARFAAHQIGDPRDWQATGALDAPADKLAWIDAHILTLDPARVTGATILRGAESFQLDADDAVARLAALQAMTFSDVHPAAQMLTTEMGQLAFALADGGALTVSVRMQGNELWLALSGTAAGATNIPPGAWVFHYPADAAAVLQPPA